MISIYPRVNNSIIRQVVEFGLEIFPYFWTDQDIAILSYRFFFS